MATITNTRNAVNQYEDELLAMPESDTELTGTQKKEGLIALVNRFGKRNWMIVGAVVLIGAAVGLNWQFFSGNSRSNSYVSYDQAAGMMGTGELQTGTSGA